MDTSIARGIDRDLDGAVGVGPQHARADRRSRSIVSAAGWPYGLPAPAETIATLGRTASRKRRRRRRRAAVVGDLQEVDRRQAAAREERVDVVLDVAGQQERDGPPTSPSSTIEHVVDPAPAVGRLARDAARIRPQDAEPDVVQRDPVAGRERRASAARRGRRGRAAKAA